MSFHQLKHAQYIDNSVDDLWDFISSPKNLKVITSDYMGFDITSKGFPDKIYEGIIITYKVSPI